ncbi:CopD family protein [uncultured Roseobacter sp.]|uniref:CopD family protein n=1 Tax=uncultured Roseobacter sp. TaxID=114847 RepID=UPI00261E75C4|nr:CopD family protein [uncultured Roseobacter sp.]
MVEIIKALHVTGVILWMSAMLAAPALLLLTAGSPAAKGTRLYFRVVSGTGIFLTWGFGLLLVTTTGQIREPWMIAKLVIVLFLSGAHGTFAARFRTAEDATDKHQIAISAHKAIALIAGQATLIALIAMLVLVKPI